MLANETFQTEITDLIRARYSLLYINTYEEIRCLQTLEDICRSRKNECFVWSRTEGVISSGRSVSDARDPMAVLKWVEASSDKCLLVLKDFHPYLKDPGIIRKVRDLGQQFKKVQKTILFLSSVAQIPAELTKEITLVEMPLPGKAEIEFLVGKAQQCLREGTKLDETRLENLVQGASGLTAEEIENVLAKSIVSKGALDSALIQAEKKQIVKKSGVLDFVTVGGETPEIGGLHHLRQWLKVRQKGFSPQARALKLPLPKGLLMVGVPGCGKSLTAAAVGRQWQMPLLRMDIGRLFSGLVGSSESNVRTAISTCEAVAPCILWIDEIEKGLSGTQSSGGSDGGTSSRVFGTLLTWMQEKKSPVFVMATANDISQLPPEFLRKGRFDEIFFVDLPNDKERAEIVSIHLERYGWEIPDYSESEVLRNSQGFSGAELEQALISARYVAFSKEENFEQQHLTAALLETVPLSQTMGDRLEGLRSWAKHRARQASINEDRRTDDSFTIRTESLDFLESDKEEAQC